MAKPYEAVMPRDLDLGPDYVLRFAATDPSTGANVSGVVVSNVNVDTVDSGPSSGGTGGGAGDVGGYMLVPGPGA